MQLWCVPVCGRRVAQIADILCSPTYLDGNSIPISQGLKPFYLYLFDKLLYLSPFPHWRLANSGHPLSSNLPSLFYLSSSLLLASHSPNVDNFLFLSLVDRLHHQYQTQQSSIFFSLMGTISNRVAHPWHCSLVCISLSFVPLQICIQIILLGVRGRYQNLQIERGRCV